MNSSSSQKSHLAQGTTLAEQWALQWSQMGSTAWKGRAVDHHSHRGSWARGGAVSHVSHEEELDGRRNLRCYRGAIPDYWEVGKSSHQVDFSPPDPKP